ncbi:MAG TPA: MotA/TolQ/ExbB proton channel family protein [Verrucomicrobiales bacterium]|nr:MotA/TolQ/ExbB proton channel family protein [Verrucomicrobiales bacterium]HIL72462.1 MotA/TolQ/ExbB proton channel family protein [Verrucomicrobiota bacterium]
MLRTFIDSGGAMIWPLLLMSAAAIVVIIERLLHYHRAQINSVEFISGVRIVLKRGNILEAVSICDATPGPVARLAKAAILNRDRGRDGMRESLEEAGLLEVPRLEEKLNLLATIAQVAPLMGLLGTVLGFIGMVKVLAAKGMALTANDVDLLNGVWEAMISMAFGLALAIPCYIGYNYLVSRMNSILLDMEKASSEILNILTNGGKEQAYEISEES